MPDKEAPAHAQVLFFCFREKQGVSRKHAKGPGFRNDAATENVELLEFMDLATISASAFRNKTQE